MTTTGNIERRFSPGLTVEGRRLAGVGIAYGDVAVLPFGRETFQAGAFGPLAEQDVILRFQHNRERAIARTPATMQLTDGPDALRMAAKLPNTRDADDALELVRAGVFRGLSLEFRAITAPVIDGLRTVTGARLMGLGLVDTPAYGGSTVEARAFDIRQNGEGIAATFYYDVDTVISDRAATHDGDAVTHGETRQRAGVRKVRVSPGAFDFGLDDPEREVSLFMGRGISRPLGSKLAGTLEIENGAAALTFRVATLPDTGYVADYRAQVASGAAVFGVTPIYRSPPPEAVPEAVSIVPEAGNAEVLIEVVNEAILTGLAIIPRPPRGNAGEVAQRRRLWL